MTKTRTVVEYLASYGNQRPGERQLHLLEFDRCPVSSVAEAEKLVRHNSLDGEGRMFDEEYWPVLRDWVPVSGERRIIRIDKNKHTQGDQRTPVRA